MKRKLNKLFFLIRNDIRGLIFLIIRRFVIIIRKCYSTIYTYFISSLKGVSIGRNNSFYGIPIIEKAPLSKISIGNDCTFRSDSTSNWAVKKKMIIKTYNGEASIKIGNNTGANASVIVASEKVVIGNDVLIGFNCYIADTDSHAVDPLKRHTNEVETAPVAIKDNVWLGANVVVLKGVTIGENTVIGSNSVVLSNIPSNVVALGFPCRVIKKI